MGEMETRHFTSSEVVVPSETPESNQKAGKVSNMKTSKAGIDFIISYEGGCHLSIYDATNPSNKYQRGRIGDWTIGHGHKLTEEELKSGVYDKGITEEKAKELFADDLVNIEQGIHVNFTGGKLTQFQFDALVSLGYNVGRPALVKSNIFALAEKGETDEKKNLGTV